MTRTLFLHIGMGRCGSSSIQHFADRHRAALRERGLDYPTSAELGYPKAPGGNAQAIAEAKEDPGTVFASVADYVKASPCERVLLSSEFLYSMNMQNFADFREVLDAADTRLVAIAYVREQRSWLISRYAQAVKSRRLAIPMQAFIERRYRAQGLNYSKKFRLLKRAFGGNNLALRVFQRDRLLGGDVRADLFDITGLDVTGMLDDDSSTNASGSILEIEAMRVINETHPDGGFNHRAFLRHTAQMCKKRGWVLSRELYRLVEPAFMREVGEFFRVSNAAFQARFFPKVEGSLFADNIPDDYTMAAAEERMNERTVQLILNHHASIAQETAEAHTAKAAADAVRARVAAG